MTIASEALVRLHRIHRQLGDLRGRLARGPKQVAAGAGNLAEFKAEQAKIKEVRTKTKMLADEKQLHLRQREIRLEDLQTKLNSCGSNREYQMLSEQIAADRQANSVLADEILELLERLDVLDAEVAEAEQHVAASRESLSALQEKVAAEAVLIEADITRLAADLKDAEKALTGDVRVEYNRLARTRGEDSLAEVDDQVCVGCFQTITPQMYNELKLQKAVFCKSCGRLLYLPEGS